MGRLPIFGQDAVNEYHRKHRADPAAPFEPNDDGCPGGWYRGAFASSVARYERTILDNAIANNPILDRCDDPLVLEATAYLEMQRLRHRHHWQAKINGA